MDWLSIAAIVVMMGLSAFFSASETAFSSVNKIRLLQLSETDKRAKRALKIAENFNSALTSILIGNNIVNIFSASLGTVICTTLFGAKGIGIATAAMTVLVLIFGEILPKSLAHDNAEKFAIAAALPLSILMVILTPITALFNLLKGSLSKGQTEPTMTESELKYFINAIEEEGVLEESESDLVKSALDLDEIRVAEILVPRVNIVAIEENTPVDEIREIFFSEKYSRLPVYEKSVDNIIGFIHEKDFFRMNAEETDIHPIIREILYTTEFSTCSELLRTMQKRKIHICVVLDQHGGTDGLVTMEDMLEELLGEIYDEADENEDYVRRIGANSYETAAETPLDLFMETTGGTLPETESLTVGGYVTELFGMIPAVGETIETDEFIFRVTRAEENHITALMIEKKAPVMSDEHETE